MPEPRTERTERFESFYDDETKIAQAGTLLPSQQIEQLQTLCAQVEKLGHEVQRVIGVLNGARSDINRIDQQMSRMQVDVRTMGMTLAAIDGPVRQIQTHLAALGAKLQSS
jgi:hypothetical protein